MIFHRCLVPNSICGPSRAVVLTGKYNHLNGFYNNTNCKFDGSQPDLPQDALQGAGYQTTAVLRPNGISRLIPLASITGTSFPARASTTIRP